MTTDSHDRHGPFAWIGYAFKRTATLLYGPADLPDEVDPIVKLDEEMGNDPKPKPEPHVSDGQRAYDNLPRGHE
jgi:hypothetical protein